MKIQGFTVDTQAIAQGVYNMFTEKERAVVAFGMLPAEKMNSLEKLLGEKVETDAKNECEKQFGFRPNTNCAKKDLKKNFVREATHQISVAIYSYANSIGKMIV